MTVYLLFSDWMYHGNTSVNELCGVYDSIHRAQYALIEEAHNTLIHQEYQKAQIYFEKPVDVDFIHELVRMPYGDPNFNFDAQRLKLCNSDDEDAIDEDYCDFWIEEWTVIN